MTDLIRQAMKWPAWLARLLARPLLFWQASAYWETMPPEYLEEARGVACGAGVHPLEVVLVTAIWEMYLVGGCSEFVVTGGMTADGSLIHGYNYDLMAPEHALINPHLAMIFYRPAGGIGFSTLNTVGSIGVNAGMSDAGLSIAWDNTYTRDPSLYEGIELPVVPFIVTLRRVLETCHSLEEGLRLVTDTLPRPLADIIIVASAEENRAVALETAGGIHAERPLEDDAVWSTNSFRSGELAPFDRNGDWREMDTEEAARAFPRYASYAGLFDRYRGRVTPRVALEILRDPYPREAEGELYHHIAHRSSICREATGFSLIMQPGLGLHLGKRRKAAGATRTFLRLRPARLEAPPRSRLLAQWLSLGAGLCRSPSARRSRRRLGRSRGGSGGGRRERAALADAVGPAECARRWRALRPGRPGDGPRALGEHRHRRGGAGLGRAAGCGASARSLPQRHRSPPGLPRRGRCRRAGAASRRQLRSASPDRPVENTA